MIKLIQAGWLSMLVLAGAAQAAGETTAAVASAPSGVAGAVSAPAASSNSGKAGADKTPTLGACEEKIKGALDKPLLKLANRFQYLPLNRPAQVLLFNPADKGLKYRVLIELGGACVFDQAVNAETASFDAGTKTGTDFLHGESTDSKTLLRFTPGLADDSWQFWQAATIRVVVSDTGGLPIYQGRLDTQVTSPGFCVGLTLLLCVLAYGLAALATFCVHKSQRADTSGATIAGAAAHGLRRIGSKYADPISHLNPVILTAGSDGRGSATKLQVLFFSLLVFGLASYILLISGHLSNLSSTVLLLLGISGLGATAATATDVSKNRLDFDNWAWLIARKWLPEGGVSEVNRAEWKDIVTTAGEFDVQRFQMIVFSLLVGGAMLVAGAAASDLGAFDIPKEMLGLLGLSQVVYISGKLTAPPTMQDLNDQIGKLIDAERKLRVGLTRSDPKADPGSAPTLPVGEAGLIARVGDDYKNYRDIWEKTRLMFNSTLGRDVKDLPAIEFPFPLWQ